MTPKTQSIRNLTMTGVFVAIVAVLSQLSIPMPYGVPMTLQTFAIPLAGVILGPKLGAVAAAVYVLLGAVGLPVYAGFSAGVGVLFGVTGGFLMGFPAMAALAGWGAARGGYARLAVGLALGIVVDYGVGLAVFMLVTGSGLGVAFAACAAPFLPLEVLKAVLVAVIGVRCRTALLRARVI